MAVIKNPDNSILKITAGGSEHIRLTTNPNETVPLWAAVTENGKTEVISGSSLIAEALTPEYAVITDNCRIQPKAEGIARFKVNVKCGETIYEKEAELRVCRAKRKATYMTAEKSMAARENISKYVWAEKISENVIKKAETYTNEIDKLYDLIGSQGVPRATGVGEVADPCVFRCRYCNSDLLSLHGDKSWLHEPLVQPYKIICPECGRRFPSNDFAEFYKLGLNEYGEFDRMRALDAHRELCGDKSITEPGAEHSAQWKAYYGYGSKEGYLYNKEYPEIYENAPSTLNTGKGLRDGETPETWGVDDSFGYVPSKADGTPYKYENGVVERHNYVGVFMHYGVYKRRPSKEDDSSGIVTDAIETCANAYFYTGEAKYGRISAILLDRIADFYPDYTLRPFGNMMRNSHGGSHEGKIIGCIWETGLVYTFMVAYDEIYDLYAKDSSIFEYINNRSKTIKFRHSKENASQICTNIEDGIFREMFVGLNDGRISGNFGYPQKPNAVGAVVLDTMPETKEWLEYLMAPGWTRMHGKCSGGGISEVLYNTVDADGMGDEASGYNIAWCSTLMDIQGILDTQEEKLLDLWSDPKFMQMVYSMLPLVSGTYSPQIGDTASMSALTHWCKSEMLQQAWQHTGDFRFAQMLYLVNKNRTEGLHYEITVPEAGKLADEVKQVIDTYGTYKPESTVMTQFGFAAIRDGKEFDESGADTRRNAFMYFGSNCGHGHKDTMTLGMTAWGLNIMPDLGYPEETGTQPNRLQWTSSTLSHNTVMVDERKQKPEPERRGNLIHFDDAGKVKFMDADASYVYGSTDTYRRGVVMVDIDGENSYYVDFFRVNGGFDHLYSFHTVAHSIRESSGLNFISQTDENGNYVGSLAGRDVPYGPDPNSPAEWDYETKFPRGYSWLKNVDRDDAPADTVELDFELNDYRGALRDTDGISMHMTMLNRANKTEGSKLSVIAADGYPPQKSTNIALGNIRYILVKHTGENLSTVFTTVFEPYRHNRCICDVQELEFAADREISGITARAVKVTLKNGRTDYIFTSTDNTVTLTVTDNGRTISFRGIAGVYSINSDGEVVGRYICDGDMICDKIGIRQGVEAVVTDFSRTITESNKITIRAENGDVNTADLAGRIVVIANDPTDRNAVYRICSAEKSGDDIVLDIGRVTSARKFVDAKQPELGFVHTIAEGMKAYIPLSFAD